MANLTDYKYDIFLSHNHADQEWTTKLAERLEQEDWQGRKLEVFFSPWDIRPGQSIPQRIEEALPKSRKVGLILSPDAMKSAWVELERLVITYISVSARDERLIPLYRRDCEIPALLQPILYLDFRNDNKFEESYETLLSVIKDEPLPRRSRSPVQDSAPVSPLIPRPPIVGFVARRDSEGRNIVERLKEELAPDKNQLVTLSGPGGVGKTTLAAEAARSLSELFEARIVWTSALGRDDYSCSTLLDEIATQLGHPEVRALLPSTKTEQVQALIASAPPLIVLDNLESIKDAERVRCEGLLSHRATCPVLITSRQKINSARNITIPNMSLEESDVFLDRLIQQATTPSTFEQLDRDRVMAASECNPLVMQWIIGQIDLAQDPGTVLDDLTHGEGDAAQRVFDRSFGLEQLGNDGRAALLALALFAPDASRTALAEVAGFGNDSKRLNEGVKRLASLHLAKPVEGSRLTVAGLTRELAKARLANDQQAGEFRSRFVDCFLRYAKTHSHSSAENYDVLEREKDNLIGAMDVAFMLGHFNHIKTIAAILASPYYGMLRVRGYWDEAMQCGEKGVEAALLTDDQWGTALFAGNAAAISLDRGDYEYARTAYERSLATFKELGSDRNVGVGLHQLGMIAQKQNNLEDARKLYSKSLEIKKTIGDEIGIAATLHNLAQVSVDLEDFEEGRRLYEESLDIEVRRGNKLGIAISLSQIGRLHHLQEKYVEARHFYNESLKIKTRLGDQAGIAVDSYYLALLAEREGDGREAARLFREALAIFEKLGSTYAEVARQSLARVECKSS